MTFHPDSLPDLTGKTYIVTGGTSGIGYYTVARLAEHGAHVYLCARSEDKGQKAVESIQSLYARARLSVLVMDHHSLQSVASAAEIFLSNETELHGLVNNAGVMATPYKLTDNGYEDQWQTNYLAHWIFTSRLLPLLLETSKKLPAGSVRIVNVSSGSHMAAPSVGINFSDTSLPNESAIVRYGQSKLANILHAKTLNLLYGPGSSSAKAGNGEIWTTAVHPGMVFTSLRGRAVELPWFMKFLGPVIEATGGRWPADEGAWTSVYCVASPELEASHSGGYFVRIAKPGMHFGKAKDMNLAEKLEKWTETEMKKHGFVSG
ncbi:unnamed protein product [Clonostachys rosea]|uniref:NAD(P)-binding protein n=1 Tax=Bionectria ochroleuca TaxID=29856 RepID=A0ABY6UDD8_BIOOC|nr:unnamed protein product [Clonostachys rosea]